MVSRWRRLLWQFSQKLWVLALLYTCLGIGTALVAPAVGPFLPDGLGRKLGSGAVETVLTVLASSMLSVVTFSLGIMVSAFTAAAGSVTPRTTALLKTDKTTQRVLSTFLGSFLFSLIGLIALKAGVYSDNDRLVLFVVTIMVVAVIVIAILRWIAHLTVFGLMNDSIAKVETAACDALERRLSSPFLGGHVYEGPVPLGAEPVHCDDIGYLCHIDMAELQEAAQTHGLRLFLAALPGGFVHSAMAAIWVVREGTGQKSDFDSQSLCDALTVSITRNFDQDPRFGLAVLAEIAERALSPAVNDPGTAIDILGRAVRLLAAWAHPPMVAPKFDRIWVPPLRISDAFDDVFPPIARDGAGIFAVQIRLQKALLALARLGPQAFGQSAVAQSSDAMVRCHDKMLPSELERLKEVVAEIARVAEPQSATAI